LPESRQSFGARLAAFARFMAVPIFPGIDPVSYDRAQEQPVPPTPHLALDNADWMASHRAEGSVMVGSTLKKHSHNRCPSHCLADGDGCD